MKNILLIVVVLLVMAGGFYYYFVSKDTPSIEVTKPVPNEVVTPVATTTPVAETPIVPVTPVRGPQSIIGESVKGEPITAYHFGTGTKEVVLIGGTHGGYSWNTALLAYELIAWLEKTPTVVPEGITVTIIPVLNPDGLSLIAGTADRFTVSDIEGSQDQRTTARFNANQVDINRNFDCEWQSVGTWQNKSVSGGATAFSEPESKAIKAYVEKTEPVAIVAWYSAAGGVYASNCKNGILPQTKIMTDLFAKASGYTAHEEYDYYEITGDMVNWFAKEKIPAISVLLSDHQSTELAKNQAGIKALLKNLSE
jgi:hypothetical protein